MAPPAPGGVTREKRPRIFCRYTTLAAPADVKGIRMFVDGSDVTRQARRSSWEIAYVPPVDLSTGAHRVRVILADRAGNTLEREWTFTIDPRAPDTEGPRIIPLAPTPPNGAVLARAGEALLRFRIQDPGGAGVDIMGITIEMVEPDGRVRVFPPAIRTPPDNAEGVIAEARVHIAPGAHSWRVRARDRAGNAAAALVSALAVDDLPPIIGVVRASPAIIEAGESVTLFADVHDEGPGGIERAFFEIRLPKGAVATLLAQGRAGRFSARWPGGVGGASTPLPAGRYRASLVVIERCGRITRSARGAEFNIAAPKRDQKPLPLVLDQLRRSVTRAQRLSISGDSAPGAEVEVYVNAARAASAVADRKGRFQVRDVPLPEGLVIVTARARDLDTGAFSRLIRASRRLSVDRTPPRVVRSSLSPAPGARVSTRRPEIRLRLEEQNPGDVRVSITAGGVSARVREFAGVYRGMFPRDLAPGPHDVVAEFVDAAGNRGVETWRIVVDPPVAHRLPDPKPSTGAADPR